MTSLVYDFKDIASRMKGELKQEPAPEVELMPLPPAHLWRDMSTLPNCIPCNGSGVDPFNGNVCKCCYGRGVTP